jgi:putative oxidoreductase
MEFVTNPDTAATLARIVLGVLFVAHGWPKIRNVKKPMAWVKSTGWPYGEYWAFLFTFLEFFGGLALIVGFLTQVVAVLIALEMVATGIFSKQKLGKKFFSGYELDVVYMFFALVISILGPGPWSIDRILGFA